MISRCYLRVSTEDQAKEGYSLAAQRDRLSAFASSQGWKVADFYVDEGISAKDMNRPSLKRLLKETRKGEVVLVYKLDRLTRNVADLDHLLRKWDAEGVQFRSSTEDFNTTTAAGRLFIRLVADLAQWERENLGERVRMGMTKRAQEGEWNGGPAPFGYSAVETGERNGQKVRRKLEHNEHAPIVLEIYRKYVSGEGVRTITKWLNYTKGIKSPRGSGFTDATVSLILQNPVYCGLIAWSWGHKSVAARADVVMAEGKHSAIVSREMWEQAQAVRSRRAELSPRQATGVNILTGVGRCGLCGAGLVSTGDRKKGFYAYRCGQYAAKAGGCSFTCAPKHAVEKNFVDAVCGLAEELTNPERAHDLALNYLKETRGSVERMSPEEIRRQVSHAKQAAAVWDSALEQGRISFEFWEEKTGPHFTRIGDLEAQLKDAEETAQMDLAVEALTKNLHDFRVIWDAALPQERKTLAISFFKEVRVFPDRHVELVPRLSYSAG